VTGSGCAIRIFGTRLRARGWLLLLFSLPTQLRNLRFRRLLEFLEDGSSPRIHQAGRSASSIRGVTAGPERRRRRQSTVFGDGREDFGVGRRILRFHAPSFSSRNVLVSPLLVAQRHARHPTEEAASSVLASPGPQPSTAYVPPCRFSFAF
jgi:hypothetical protein